MTIQDQKGKKTVLIKGVVLMSTLTNKRDKVQL